MVGTYSGRERRGGGVAAESHRSAEMLFTASTCHRPRDDRAMMYHGTGRRTSLDDAIRSVSPSVCRSPARRCRTPTMTESAPVTRHGGRRLRRAPQSTYHSLQQQTRSAAEIPAKGQTWEDIGGH